MATTRVGPLVALAGVSVAATLTLARVFRDGSFLLPAIGAVLFAHAIGWFGTSRRWSPIAHEAAALAGLVLYLGWVIEPSTTFYGLPVASTFSSLAHDLSDGLAAVRTAVAPAPVTSGLLLLTVGGAYLCAHLADWAAQRLGATIQALVPPFVMFIVASALGTSQLRVLTTGFFLLWSLMFLLAQSSALQAAAAAWASTPSRRTGAGLLVISGLPIVAIVVLIGLILGPAFPGAGASAMVSWKGVGNHGSNSRQTISPLVDLRPRLTQSPVLELFTVRAPEAHNWRLTALDTFDGQHWTSVATYRAAKGTLFKERDDVSPIVKMHQTYSIERLDSFWLPAAYRPTRIGLKGSRVNDASLTLLTDKSTAAGLQYTVDSQVPNPTAEELSAAPAETGFSRDTALPADFPPQVRALAESITRTAKTPYAKARAIQDYLRSHYTYNENVRPGHSDSALVAFLFETKQGYCEQFAGAFAAMARVVGLPTRVAVGFTPGRFDGDVYKVDTNNAHAWPEVHLKGFGWVPFEPTPSRFELTSGNHTGTLQTTPTIAGPNTPTTTVTGDANAANTPTTLRRGEDLPGTVPSTRRRPGISALSVLGFVAAGATGTVLLYAIAVLMFKANRRRRRTQGDPGQRIAGAWAEALDRLDEAGTVVGVGATPNELAHVAGRAHIGTAVPMADLADLHTRAEYSGSEPSPHDADVAWAAVVNVVTALDRADTPRGRWRRRLDPGLRRRVAVRVGAPDAQVLATVPQMEALEPISR